MASSEYYLLQHLITAASCGTVVLDYPAPNVSQFPGMHYHCIIPKLIYWSIPMVPYWCIILILSYFSILCCLIATFILVLWYTGMLWHLMVALSRYHFTAGFRGTFYTESTLLHEPWVSYYCLSLTFGCTVVWNRLTALFWYYATAISSSTCVIQRHLYSRISQQ